MNNKTQASTNYIWWGEKNLLKEKIRSNCCLMVAGK
jgi:hypothetical protein